MLTPAQLEDRRIVIASAVGAAALGLFAYTFVRHRDPLDAIRRWPVQDIQAQAANAVYKDTGKLKRTAGGTNPWDRIDGITLHHVGVPQVGLSAHPRMTYHLTVHHDGTVYWLHPLNTRLFHGHGLNNNTVGISVAGAFGDPSINMPPAQVMGLRRAIVFAYDQLRANGAPIRYLYAHRQSHSSRGLDPGRSPWLNGAVWAERYLPLQAAPDYFRDSGKPIPIIWDERGTPELRFGVDPSQYEAEIDHMAA